MSHPAERQVVRAQARAQVATEKRDAAFADRAETFRAAYQEGVSVSRICELAGIEEMAVRKAIWPPDGRSGARPRQTT